MTECKLDKMVNKLNHILNKALDNSCPVAKARSIDPNNPWWTPQLKDKRHKVTKTYDKYKYRKQQKEYKKLKRKAKKNYEHLQNETVADEEAMTKKIKNLTTSIQPKVTTLKLPSGKYTETGKETCEEMMSKHFPTHTPKTNPEHNHTKIVTTEITKPDYKPWITESHVRRVLLKFKAKKSPGPDKLKPIILNTYPRIYLI